ncbi:MAG: adenosylcobinamide-GDP ribazoletransferase [Elusimicrobia bacterium]|nr:adenosylcobinamide-GDP ribazoletransferase [Elusimicrobiota bacterium]
MDHLRRFLVAVQFFTRIPVTGALAEWVAFDDAKLRASAAHFPGVGWVVGGLTAVCFSVACMVLPRGGATPWVAAFLSTTLGVLLTGAFHEDGLADLADGLGGAMDRERALEIMKDPRIGSYGALALVLALAGKLSLLAALAQKGAGLAILALFAAHVSSRWMPLLVIRTLPYVGDLSRSKAKPLADSIGLDGLAVASAWWGVAMALVVACRPGWQWLSAVAGGLLGLAWMRRLLARRLQGFTGDALGATQQVCELCFYLGLLAAQ